MGIRNLIRWIRLHRAWSRFKEALREEKKMATSGYDFWKTTGKGLWAFLLVAGASVLTPAFNAAVAALADLLSNSTLLTGMLTKAGASAVLTSALVAVLTSVGVMLRDWLKHK